MYSVSTFGQVRNDVTGRILSQSRTGHGAAKVGLWDGHKQTARSVKVLVSEVFVEGRTHIFDTAINLDGDLTNNRITNLTWRPRWFAHKYSHQFIPPISRVHYVGPVINTNTGEAHNTVVDTGIYDGVLFRDIQASMMRQEPVFPHRFVYKRAN